MNHLYTSFLVVHVLVAVLGIGSIVSITVLAATVRVHAGAQAPGQISAWMAPLLRYSGLSLAVMLVTGILMDFAAHGAFHEAWWFRGSAVLLIATGALHGLARRTVRFGPAGHDGNERALRRVERIGYGMCALIAAITLLMELKPF